MASQGPNSAGKGSDTTVTWYNTYENGTDNIKTSNNQYAEIVGSRGFTSPYLYATNFGFTIPSGATIDGIKVDIERKSTYLYSNGVRDYNIKIIKSDSSIGSTDKADTVNYWPTSDTVKSYGGSTDKWGETWLYSDINNSNFGVAVKVLGDSEYGKFTVSALIDHISITVYYTEGGSSSAIKSVNGLAKSSVKSVNGLAIASVKSINGLA